MDLEAKDFGYSLKNIPIPSQGAYLKCLVEKIESLIIRMRYKVIFRENSNDVSLKTFNNYGFKSKKTPSQNELLKPFEDELVSLVRRIKFKTVKDPFLKKLKEDVENINRSEEVYVFADKTTNFYPISKENYQKIKFENISSRYKKSVIPLNNEINNEAADIAVDLKLHDRMEAYAQKEAFMTFKDHKDDFVNRPQCRLINPAKTEIGKVSKTILEGINKQVREETKLLQWRNSAEVIKWFEGRKVGKKCMFIQFDICEFYPSISEKLLKDSLEFAQEFYRISNEELKIIMHCRKSLLFSSKEEWVRKKKSGASDLFDVTMGSFDGAEICELVGLYLLNEIKRKLGDVDIGLYRDDGLGIFPKLSGTEAERFKKEIRAIFKKNGMKITIDTNLRIVNFLDVTFNLNKNSYYPYRKPNSTPLYVNKNSNHPRSIIKQLPKMINRRICEISCNEEEFIKAKPIYQEALKRSGYSEEMRYEKFEKAPKNRRRRKIMWFTPPFSKNVETNIGKEFLKLINKHFPADHKYHSLFNRSNLKISYCCMPNIEKIIKGHNSKILNVQHGESRSCNCRVKECCPLNGKCLTSCLVYKADLVSEDAKKVYYGACEGSFKERWGNHKKSFKNPRYKDESKLSQHVWELNEKKKKYEISWSIVKKCRPYKSTSRRCDLCLSEKLIIVQGDEKQMINKRSEILNKCRHSNKYSFSRILERRISAVD